MEDNEDGLRQENSNMVDGQNEDVGMEQNASSESGDSDAGNAESGDNNYTDAVRKRIHQQAKKHHREMRAMQEQMAQLQAQIGQPQSYQQQPTTTPYSSGQPNVPSTEEERIQRAVRYALDAKDAESRRAKEAESQMHVQKQYQRLQNEFDNASDKYEDFDDVVRGDAPFTAAMRDALLFVDNPAEVAYKLGKNREELSRLSSLHPLDQAREITKLSFALMSGGSGKTSSATRGNPINPLRANPAGNSSANTDKLSPSTIRTRMRAGTWK